MSEETRGKIHCDAEVILAKRWYRYRAESANHTLQGSEFASSEEEAIALVKEEHGPIFGDLKVEILPAVEDKAVSTTSYFFVRDDGAYRIDAEDFYHAVEKLKLVRPDDGLKIIRVVRGTT